MIWVNDVLHSKARWVRSDFGFYSTNDEDEDEQWYLWDFGDW
jgi:hypothetical protein